MVSSWLRAQGRSEESFDVVERLRPFADERGLSMPQVALGWYERDAADGEGEMPYPPEYPKMPGEPPRVQPSRARHDD